MATLTVKNHKVQLTGNLMTGDTYPVKEFIKKFLSGKWNAEAKGWTVDLHQVETWTGTCIQAVTETDAPAASKTSRDNWTVNTKYGRELAEDY